LPETTHLFKVTVLSCRRFWQVGVRGQVPWKGRKFS